MDDVTYDKPNILIVDDIKSNLVILAEIVQNMGYIARPVTCARQALDAVNVLLPHLILLDITMPDIDGFELCTILERNVNTKNIPVIFISALDSPDDKIRGFQLGAVDYITKPFEIEEVIYRINIHLIAYKKQQELEKNNKKLYKIISNQMGKIYDEQKNILFALAKITENRTVKSKGHMERISKLSRLLAISMQMSARFENEISNSFIDMIEVAAPLHDIGRIAFDDVKLYNKVKVNEMELNCAKLHTEIGANILMKIHSLNKSNDYINMAIDIAWFHHENWEGSGYPKGLSGNEIPLSARIVSVVNKYDYLASQWNLSTEKCMKMIEENSGIEFDPEIVTIFKKIQNQI